MRRDHKLITTIWTTLLACPIVFILISMAKLSCGEMDPCTTGGPMPYAGVTILLAVAIVLLQVAFLVMIWRPTGD